MDSQKAIAELDFLPLLLDPFEPAANAAEMDVDISTAEIVANLLAHTGVEISLKDVNAWMHENGYKATGTADFRIVWMLKKRDVL